MGKDKPDPMALHGSISKVDGKMWDAYERAWVEPHAEGLAYAAARGGPEAKARAELLTRMTTLQELPGHRITQVLGVVTSLSAASGWTAGVKGRDALEQAQAQLFEAAQARGANAVVGMTGSTFGAGGGITSVFGGDAVGVLLMGTAVVVEVVQPAPQ